jgi:hypothetical protein
MANQRRAEDPSHEAITRRVRPVTSRTARSEAATMPEIQAVAAPIEERVETSDSSAGRYSYVAPAPLKKRKPR